LQLKQEVAEGHVGADKTVRGALQLKQEVAEGHVGADKTVRGALHLKQEVAEGLVDADKARRDIPSTESLISTAPLNPLRPIDDDRRAKG